jgi:tight adherence protein C
MIIFLVIGLFLTGSAVALFARALIKPRLQATETVAEVQSYGFKARAVAAAREHQPNDLALRQRADSLALAVGEALAKQFPSLSVEATRRHLMAAGMYTTSPLKVIGYQALGGVVLPALWLWLAISGHVNALLTVVGVIAMAFIGWAGPSYFVRRRAEARLTQIENAIPDMIDTLVTVVEAGIAFAGALQLAARRFRGPLGAELRLTLQEQSMGLGMQEALADMAERANTPSMRSFVRSMVQGEALGVPIGQTLRALAVEMRKRRRQRAEERAQKAPVKMLFPLVFLIFPSMFLIILGPAMLRITSIFGG